jgi:hypothetical protein
MQAVVVVKSLFKRQDLEQEDTFRIEWIFFFTFSIPEPTSVQLSKLKKKTTRTEK